MRRVIAALVVALLVIALIAPAAAAGASPTGAGHGGASGSWWQQLFAAAWSVFAGADIAPRVGSAATNARRGFDQGPTMEPNGVTAPPSSQDQGPTMDPDG